MLLRHIHNLFCATLFFSIRMNKFRPFFRIGKLMSRMRYRNWITTRSHRTVSHIPFSHVTKEECKKNHINVRYNKKQILSRPEVTEPVRTRVTSILHHMPVCLLAAAMCEFKWTRGTGKKIGITHASTQLFMERVSRKRIDYVGGCKLIHFVWEHVDV
jgi:hypothetical protein